MTFAMVQRVVLPPDTNVFGNLYGGRLKLIKNGMSVGLGTGSTVKYFLEGLAARVQDGLEITGIPTSRQTEQVARKLGIRLDLDLDHVDIDVDGADAFDPHGTLIKGGGGALFREKVG